MAAHFITSTQKIPVSVEEAWRFFSTPANLATITPVDMGFEILKGDHTTLFQGQEFEYRVRPLFRIPMYWKTLISTVEAPRCFVDEQVKGPYKVLQHRHEFKPIEGGVEMTDTIRYEIPLGPLGSLANRWFVRKRLRSIFEYRFRKVEEMLGAWPAQKPRIQIQ